MAETSHLKSILSNITTKHCFVLLCVLQRLNFAPRNVLWYRFCWHNYCIEFSKDSQTNFSYFLKKLFWFFICSDISRVFLGRLIHILNPQRCHHGWCWVVKFSKFEPPDALKIHSVALYVLRFHLTFSKLLLSWHHQTFNEWFFKNSYIHCFLHHCR